MSERIEVGDLVMVMRGCCAKFDNYGLIATAIEICHNDICVSVACCKSSYRGTLVHLSGAMNPLKRWVPLPWLKKIPPLTEPEVIEHKEELPA